MRLHIVAIAISMIIGVSGSEHESDIIKIDSLYACAWFPLCTEPDNSQKSEKNKDSSSKDKKDQKESGRMA